MGSLLKVTKDEVAKRVPGRDRGPARMTKGALTTAKGALTTAKGVTGLVRARRDQKRAQERRSKRTKVAAAAGAAAAAGGAYVLAQRTGSSDESLTDQSSADEKLRSEGMRPVGPPAGSVNAGAGSSAPA